MRSGLASGTAQLNACNDVGHLVTNHLGSRDLSLEVEGCLGDEVCAEKCGVVSWTGDEHSKGLKSANS